MQIALQIHKFISLVSLSLLTIVVFAVVAVRLILAGEPNRIADLKSNRSAWFVSFVMLSDEIAQ